MKRRSFHLALTMVGLAGVGPSRAADETGIPHVAALDRSAVKVDRLDDPLNHALILGNGDLNGLVWTEGRGVVLTVTKNDVWDARLDSALDPPLPTLARIKELAAGEWPDRTLVLPKGSTWKGPDSYHAHPYPCPRSCARIRIGDVKRPRWTQIRGEGSVNAWQRRGNETVMRIAGDKGASNGFSYGPLELSTDQYPKLHVTLAGSENAKYYIDVIGDDDKILFASKWTDSPVKLTEQVFDLAPGKRVRRLILYTWIEEGDKAENRFASAVFTGPDRKHAVDLDVSSLGAKATLDIRRAVAHPPSWNGRRLSARADFAPGSPALPMSYGDVAAKFRACADFAGWPAVRAEQAIEVVATLDDLADVRELTRLLSA